MRVLHVLHSMSFGGAEVLVHDFVRATQSEAQHAIVCLDSIGPLGEALRADGVRVDVLGRTEGLQPEVALALRRVLTDVKPDVVCAHQYTPYSYAAMAVPTVRPQPGLVFVEHGRHYPDARRPKRVFVNNLVFLRYTQRVVAVCGYIKALLVQNEGIPAHRIDVVYNGVDPTRFDPATAATTDPAETRASMGLRPEHQVITCVARFHPVKDHPTLVRAFARVARACPDARLALVGGGDKAPLISLVTELGIADRVVFPGVRRDIPAVYAATDLFAMSSKSEGTSVTLLEAMLSERAAVVTDVGGNPEIVDPGVTGLLSPRGDDAALAESLQALLGDPARRREMGARGRRRVLARFTQSQMHRQWLGLLQESVPRR